jgi:hypothetical protein
MLSDPPRSCHSTSRWGPHGSNQPCCLPPPRRHSAVAAGCPEPVWSFCALAGQSFVCSPFQPPRSCFLQRGSCNQTRRPRPLHRDRPAHNTSPSGPDAGSIVAPSHAMPLMLADRDPRLCTLPSDSPRSSVFVSHWHCANRTAPKDPRRSSQLRAGRKRQPKEMSAGPVSGEARGRRPSVQGKAASRRGSGPADER